MVAITIATHMLARYDCYTY